jgi:hypothetical protein
MVNPLCTLFKIQNVGVCIVSEKEYAISVYSFTTIAFKACVFLVFAFVYLISVTAFK